ncbi:hypothetical protein lerEdw1_004256 [Lerista edwardsae]|nr:hypothetical protein lerEdw1_004256 [Lerista edwardsae]
MRTDKRYQTWVLEAFWKLLLLIVTQQIPRSPLHTCTTLLHHCPLKQIWNALTAQEISDSAQMVRLCRTMWTVHLLRWSGLWPTTCLRYQWTPRGISPLKMIKFYFDISLVCIYPNHHSRH